MSKSSSSLRSISESSIPSNNALNNQSTATQSINQSTPRIMIICLGDLGRSPRMMYHALSCIKHGYSVDLIGLKGSDLIPELQAAAERTSNRSTSKNNQSINQIDSESENPMNNQFSQSSNLSINQLTPTGDLFVHRFDPPFNYSVADESTKESTNQSTSRSMLRIPPILLGGVKVILQSFKLAKICLIDCSDPTTILVQNPPSIPTLVVSFFVSFFKSSNLIIDWHNFGYSILGLVLDKKNQALNQSINQSFDASTNDSANQPISQSSNRIVQICLLYEKFFGRLASGHLCVTQSMQQWLNQEWSIDASVLYDRPPQHFAHQSIKQATDLFADLDKQGLVDQDEINQWLMSITQKRNQQLGYQTSQSISQSTHKSQTAHQSSGPSLQSIKESIISYFDESTNQLMYRADRPALIVSSTSWTPDEDFQLMISALIDYEQACLMEYEDASINQSVNHSTHHSHQSKLRHRTNQSINRSLNRSLEESSDSEDDTIDELDDEFDDMINESINQSNQTNQSSSPSNRQSIDQPIDQFVVDLLATAKIDDLSIANDVLMRRRRKMRSIVKSTAHQSINHSTHQSINHSTHQSINQSTHQSCFLPPLLVFITGKGPMLSDFRAKINQLKMTHVKVLTPFLRFVDYPLMLGSCDIGVSMHTSSSGLDLPMKMVDMFGCGLPVLAVNFHSLFELIGSSAGVRGYTFTTGDSLSLYLSTLFGQWPNQSIIDHMRTRVEEWASVRWDETWEASALPLINPSSNQSINSSTTQSTRSNRSNRSSNQSINQSMNLSLNQLLTSPTTFVSTSFRSAQSIIQSMPYHYRSLLTVIFLALMYRCFMVFSPFLYQFYADPRSLWSQCLTWGYHVWDQMWIDYANDGLMGVLSDFAQSPIASYFVFSLVFGSLFWLAVVYAINQSINQSINHSVNQSVNQVIDQTVNQSIDPLVNHLHASLANELTGLSSEEEK